MSTGGQSTPEKFLSVGVLVFDVKVNGNAFVVLEEQRRPMLQGIKFLYGEELFQKIEMLSSNPKNPKRTRLDLALTYAVVERLLDSKYFLYCLSENYTSKPINVPKSQRHTLDCPLDVSWLEQSVDFYVIKPCEGCQGVGVSAIKRESVMSYLESVAPGPTDTVESVTRDYRTKCIDFLVNESIDRAEFNISRCRYALATGEGIIVQPVVRGTPIGVRGGAKKDPTVRIVVNVLANDNDRLTLEPLASYYKLPIETMDQSPSSVKGSQLVSYVSAKNGANCGTVASIEGDSEGKQLVGEFIATVNDSLGELWDKSFAFVTSETSVFDDLMCDEPELFETISWLRLVGNGCSYNQKITELLSTLSTLENFSDTARSLVFDHFCSVESVREFHAASKKLYEYDKKVPDLKQAFFVFLEALITWRGLAGHTEILQDLILLAVGIDLDVIKEVELEKLRMKTGIGFSLLDDFLWSNMILKVDLSLIQMIIMIRGNFYMHPINLSFSEAAGTVDYIQKLIFSDGLASLKHYLLSGDRSQRRALLGA